MPCFQWAFNARMHFSVGASLLAMVINENACFLNKRGALESIASRLAPTEIPVRLQRYNPRLSVYVLF
ncbi:hypothetical protein DM828_22755 [Pseudomonas umsongensis]|nr:hypothetical protein [Pseudomonas umsongensis]